MEISLMGKVYKINGVLYNSLPWVSWQGKPHAKIVKIEIAEDEKSIEEFCGCGMAHVVGDIEIVWLDPKDNDGEFDTP
jgi:hypothetical protein